MSELISNLNYVEQDLARLANLYQTTKPRLVAVSKYQSQEKIEELLKAGHKVFAENLVQEAMSKWSGLKERYKNIELQMVGHLQSNKVKQAVGLFDVIASVDSIKLAKKLKDEMDKQKKQLAIYLQVNIAGEQQKTGFSVAEISEAIKIIRNELGFEIKALMCVPPNEANPVPYFAKLKQIARKNDVKECSMGMSNDYEKAIAVHTDEVRIGSLIFGKRIK